jgi:hypothetical protein
MLVLGPMWGGAFFLSLLLAVTTKPSSRGVRFEGGYYVITFVLLLTLTVTAYSSGSEKPWREINVAYFAWRYPEAVTYDSLYDAYWADAYWGQDWVEPFYAAGVIKYRDSLPEYACQLTYSRYIREDDPPYQVLKTFRVERRDGIYKTASPTAKIRSQDGAQILLEDRLGDSIRVATRVQMNAGSVTRLTDAGLSLRVDCFSPGPQRMTSGFVSLFYSFLEVTRWPWFNA